MREDLEYCSTRSVPVHIDFFLLKLRGNDSLAGKSSIWRCMDRGIAGLICSSSNLLKLIADCGQWPMFVSFKKPQVGRLIDVSIDPVHKGIVG